MLLVKIIGFTLLGVLLLLLALLWFVLCARLRFELRGKNDDCVVRLGIGPARIKVYDSADAAQKPSPEKPEKPPKPKKPKKPKKKKPHATPHFENMDFGAALDLALSLLGQLKNALLLETLLLNLVIATEDAAKTGMLFGGASAAAGMLVPFLDETFRTKELHVILDADFEQTKTKWAAVVVCAVRPIRVLWVLLCSYKPLRALYKQIMQKDEAMKHE